MLTSDNYSNIAQKMDSVRKFKKGSKVTINKMDDLTKSDIENKLKSNASELVSIKEYCNKIRMFNYGKLRGKYSDESIFIKIRNKKAIRKTLPDYVDKYSWLTIYDDEIDFLIEKMNEKGM